MNLFDRSKVYFDYFESFEMMTINDNLDKDKTLVFNIGDKFYIELLKFERDDKIVLHDSVHMIVLTDANEHLIHTAYGIDELNIVEMKYTAFNNIEKYLINLNIELDKLRNSI